MIVFDAAIVTDVRCFEDVEQSSAGHDAAIALADSQCVSKRLLASAFFELPKDLLTSCPRAIVLKPYRGTVPIHCEILFPAAEPPFGYQPRTDVSLLRPNGHDFGQRNQGRVSNALAFGLDKKHVGDSPIAYVRNLPCEHAVPVPLSRRPVIARRNTYELVPNRGSSRRAASKDG